MIHNYSSTCILLYVGSGTQSPGHPQGECPYYIRLGVYSRDIPLAGVLVPTAPFYSVNRTLGVQEDVQGGQYQCDSAEQFDHNV